jgi:hypothetical protein
MPLWLGKIIATRIVKAIKHQIDLKKIDKQVHRNVSKNGKNIEQMEKEIAILKRDSHPKSDWVCLKCGCKAKKVEKPTRKRRRKLKKEK